MWTRASSPTHARRRFATYYIEAAGEVDVAIVSGRRFFPIEVKWRTRVRPSDLEQVSRYRNGTIVGHTEGVHRIGQVPLVPLPRALALLERGAWPPSEAGT